MARVNVRCWQETYRGLMSDAVLDDPGFLAELGVLLLLFVFLQRFIVSGLTQGAVKG